MAEDHDTQVIIMENDKLVRLSDVLAELWYPFDFNRAKIDTNMRAIPAVDAVEVIRCRECIKSAYDKDFGKRWCCRLLSPFEVPDDWYCAGGKRREEEHNAAD